MKKSLFAKYFTICCVIILSTMVVLGGVFSILVSRYMRTERQQLLSANVSKAVSFTQYNFESTGRRFLDRKTINRFYSSMADNIKGVVFFSDVNGDIVIYTDNEEFSYKTNKISSAVMSVIDKNGEYKEYGKLENIYSTMHYTIGKSVTTENGTVVIGYIFASTSAVAVSELIKNIFKMFLLASVVAIFISSIIIYFFTSFLSRPLRQMNLAAKSFGSGDFSARITYNGADEIGQLANSFNQMADSLSELEIMSKNLIANVSHELKTPMTSIGGFIDGILDGTIPREEQDKYLKIVSEEIKRLSRLVKSLLSVAKLEGGETKLNLKPFDISETIIKTLFNFEKKISEKNIDVRGLEKLDKVFVYGDEDLIHQVVYNLIDNAVKFCNTDGYIDFIFEQEEKYVKIHVINSGAGLSKEELNHVFDRFYKTDKSRGLDKNGVGLGLYIVKSILEMSNGSIAVGSVKGEYTEFIFKLPLYSD